MKKAVLSGVVACGMGLMIGLVAGGALADSGSTLDADVAALEEFADQGSETGKAEMRRGLTRILEGMIYTDAPDRRIAEIEAQLEPLGGPDPSVEPIDGPDNATEWQMQVDLDRESCDSGDEAACENLPESEVRLTEALNRADGKSDGPTPE